MGNNGNEKKSPLTISHIRMYEEMVSKELEPVARILEARGAAIKDTVMVQVKRDLGVYDLILKKMQLQAEMAEVESLLRNKTSNQYIEVNGERRWMSPIEAEVDRRMKEENRPLEEVKVFKESLMKDIRLSLGTPEIKAMFDKLTPQVEKMLRDAKKLPALRVKPLTEKDMAVLKG